MLRLFDPTQQFQDRSGALLVGGSVTVYLDGTDDLAKVYNDELHAMQQPVPIDSDGRVAGLFVQDDKTYWMKVKDASGNTLFTITDMTPSSTPGSIDGKVDKVVGATAGNLAILTEDGDIEDSGFGIDDIKNFPSYVILDRTAPTTTFAKVKEIFNSGKIPLVKNNSDLYVPSSLSDYGSTFSCITSTNLRGIIINNAGVFDSDRYFSPMRVLTIYSGLSSTNLFDQLKDLVDNTYVIVRLFQSSNSSYRYATLDSFQLNDDENDYVYFKFVEPFVYFGSKVYGVTYKENDVIINYGSETERTDFGAVIPPSDIADEDVEHGSRTIVCEIKGMQFRCAYHTKQQTTSSQFFFDIVDKDYADDWSESPVTLYDMQSFIYYPFRSTYDTQAVRNNWYDLVTQPDGARGGATLSFTSGDYRIPWYTYVGEPFDMEGWVKAVKGGHYMLFHYRIDGRYTADKIGFKVTLIDEGAV